MRQSEARIEAMGLMSAKESGSVTSLYLDNKDEYLFVYSTENIDAVFGFDNMPQGWGHNVTSQSKLQFILNWANDNWSAENLVAVLQQFRNDLPEDDIDLTAPSLLALVFRERSEDNSHFRFQTWLHVLKDMGKPIEPYFDLVVQWLAIEKNKNYVMNEYIPNARSRQLQVSKVGHIIRWEWLFDQEEPALELCQHFQDLLLYNEDYGFGICLRYPRRVRKMAKRQRLANIRQERRVGSRRLPGTFEYNAFGIEDEWYNDRCVEHLQPEEIYEEPETGIWTGRGCLYCWWRRNKIIR